MKTPMKKAEMFLFYRDADRVMVRLQELGMLHLEQEELTASGANQQAATGQAVEGQIRETKKALQLLKQLPEARRPAIGQLSPEEAREKVLSLAVEAEQLQQEIAEASRMARMLLPWGSFDLQRVRQLQQKGLVFQFLSGSRREFRQFDFGKHLVLTIAEEGQKIYAVAVGEEPLADHPFTETGMEGPSLVEWQQQERELHQQLQQKQQEMARLSAFVPEFEQELLALQETREHQQAVTQLEQHGEGKILLLKAWYPAEREHEIKLFLQAQPLSYRLREPLPEENVPVLLKNGRFSKLFEPITEIFQLPGYYELDLTPLIAVFYPLFFAYCLGDAGYGFVLLLGAVVAFFKVASEYKNFTVLGMVLGAFTMLMGVVKSGSLFGIPLLEAQDSAFLQYLGQFVVIPDDQNFIFNAFNVALMVGVVQILVAVVSNIVRALKYERPAAALFPFGKLLIIVSTIVLFLGGYQGTEWLQGWVAPAEVTIYIGIALVLFFHNLQQSVPARVGSGLLPLFFIFTGILGDILSYVRLFALGVASSVLGLVVNQIAGQMADGFLLTLVAGIFLLFGHSLNFALACMGAFVHSLRLTFVEFYNNAGFTGGGIPFRPFRKWTVGG